MIQTFSTEEKGFNVVLESEGWQIAILRASDISYTGKLSRMGKHMTSDEVFVLTQGSGTLYTVDDGVLQVITMERGKVYNVPRGEWHSLRLSPDAVAVVAENTNMKPEDSCDVPLHELLK